MIAIVRGDLLPLLGRNPLPFLVAFAVNPTFQTDILSPVHHPRRIPFSASPPSVAFRGFRG